MKKEIYFTALFILNLSSFLTSEEIQKISPFVEKISSRIYYKARLNKAVTLLKTFSEKYGIVSSHIDDTLFEQWYDFCQFKKLQDDQFESQFIKSIFLTLHEQLLNEEVDNIFYETDDISVVLNYIDALTHYLEDKYHVFIPKKSPTTASFAINTDKVTLRFYMLHRLRRACKLLQDINKYVLFKPYKKKKDTQDVMELVLSKVTHPHLKKTILKILYSRSIDPLLQICDELYEYRYVQDENFFPDFLLVVLAVYKKIVEIYPLDFASQDDLEFNDLDLEDINQFLTRIDSVTQSLEEIVQSFDKKNYLKQVMSWMIAPIILIGWYWSRA